MSNVARAPEPEIEITTLSNGLRVATDSMPQVASATIGVWIGAGARDERADENGLAHFLEHMAFKGTERRTARGIAEEIETVGGEVNAYTSREITAYHARVLAADVGLGFDILSDILRNPKMADADVEVERGVILQEIGQVADTPDDIVFDWAQAQSFPDQALGRSILGPAELVGRFGADELRGFMNAGYAPERMIVAAAGAVDHGAIAAFAAQAFGDLESRPAPTREPARYAGGERRVEKDLEQAHMVLGFPAPGYRDDDFFTGQIFATLLGGGMSSRLFQEAREARGLCYAIFAQNSAYADSGLTTIYAGSGGEDVGALLEVVADQIRGVVDGAGVDETARAKAQLRAGLLMGLEASSSRAERLGRGLLAHGRVRTVAELVEKVDAVDVAAVRDYAARMASGPAPTLTLYGPVADAPDLAAFQARLAA